MSDKPTIVLPTPEEIVQRIVACRDEMKALKKLYHLSKAAYDAQSKAVAEQATHERKDGTT